MCIFNEETRQSDILFISHDHLNESSKQPVAAHMTDLLNSTHGTIHGTPSILFDLLNVLFLFFVDGILQSCAHIAVIQVTIRRIFLQLIGFPELWTEDSYEGEQSGRGRSRMCGQSQPWSNTVQAFPTSVGETCVASLSAEASLAALLD